VTRYYAAVTRRSTSPKSLRHALSEYATRQRGRTTVEAVCGAQVAVAVGDWDAEHERACPRCKRAGVR
jgi:hypothetical protein